MATMSLTKVLSFSASHRLTNPALSETRNRALYGPCHRSHRYDYSLEVAVRGRVDENGMVMDAAVLEDTIRTAVLDLVDHRDLGRDVPALQGLVSTGENLARAIFDLVGAALPPGRLWRETLVKTENNRYECGPGVAAPAAPGRGWCRAG
jgi:6-pyruvoyltetrahydropterin/6-carboxytetrahydropterin synthase